MFNPTTIFTKAQGWLAQAFNGGIASLAALGNPFGKLPKVMQDAVILDTEVTGLGPGQSVFEAAINDIKNDRIIEYNLAPVRVIKEQYKYTASLSELFSYSQDWSIERINSGPFSYLKDYFSAIEANPDLLEEIKTKGSISIGNRTYLSPEEFFKKFQEDIKQSKILFVANINFENKVLGELASGLPKHKQQQIKELFDSYSLSLNSNNFLYRSVELQDALTEASNSADLSVYTKVGNTVLVVPKGAGIAKRDILDLGKASFALAKYGGYVKSGDLFSGQGISYQDLASAISGGFQEHTAQADVALERSVLKKNIKYFQALSGITSEGTTGFAARVGALLNLDSGIAAIRAQQRIEAIQPLIKKKSLLSQLSHLELFSRGIEGIPEFEYKPNLVSFDASIARRTDDNKWEVIKRNIPYKEKVDIDRSLLVDAFLDKANESLFLTQHNLDARTVYETSIKNASVDELKALWQPDTLQDKVSQWSQLIKDKMDNVDTIRRSDFLKETIKKYPKHSFGLAVGVGAIAGIAKNVFSGSDVYTPDLDSIDGITASNPAKYDLAKAYQDIENRQKKLSKIVGPINDDNLTSFYADSLTGINRGNYQQVDLSKYNVLVDDADTIILDPKGLFGKKSVIRLAGIDSPETKHDMLPDPVGPYRVKQDQPFGEESSAYLKNILENSDNLALYIDPKQKTYGRHVGMLFNDQGNINLDLVRTGRASYLPYSTDTMVDNNVFSRASSKARQNRQGMWSTDEWQRYLSSGSDLTFNTLTHGLRLLQDQEASRVFTHMYRESPVSPSGLRISSNDDDYNTIEAFRDDNMAEVSRRNLGIPFGSGWHGAEYTVPYNLSRTELISRSYYEGYRKTATSSLTKTTFRPGYHESGVGSIYSLGLPAVIDKNYQKMHIRIQTSSNTREQVDSDQNTLFEMNITSNERNYIRKQSMASAQIAESYNMFYNSKYGARGHIA